MTRTRALCAVVTVGAMVISFSGCADPEPEFVNFPSVVITGGSGIAVGGTLQLTASTLEDTDASYTWSSDDEAVATVDANGLVTAVAAGETFIRATGANTDKVGVHPVVVYSVFAPDAGTPDTGTPDGGTPDGGTPDGGAPDADAATPDAVEETAEPGPEVPYLAEWQSSGHADKSAGAFNHWNDDGEIPTFCAKCHSTGGFQDFIGADGSAAGTVDQAAALGTTVECAACHNEAADNLTSVTFPSGVEINNVGPEAKCMTCHQGRASTDSVNTFIADAAVADDDTVDEDLSFQNIHYYAAAATLNAGRVRGGYQYDGQVYDWRFRHAPGYDTCVDCHNPHTLQVRVDECSTCHTGATSLEALKDIRMMSSLSVDYDGDGDLTEGIYYEMMGLRDQLLTAIKAYTATQSLSDICYEKSSYPYWFIDTDGDGTCQESEANYGNQFDGWTARLLRAAYNYQVATQDPGAFAHNGKYIIQLLHDSLQDLNTVITPPQDLAAFIRNDPGHFNGAADAARHWDEDADVSASCSKCHGGSEGFNFFLEYGVGKSVPEQDNGLDCATCHNNIGTDWAVHDVADVELPSGVTLSMGSGASNMCSTCHSGRQANASVQANIDAGTPKFRNVHYLPAAATKAGADGAVGVEYPPKTYAPMWTGHPGGDDCSSCHSPAGTNHSFAVADTFSSCTGCHNTATTAADIRGSSHGADYDGDGAADEPLAGELEGLSALLLAEMQTVATANGFPICYGASSYPYWFADTNGDGTCDPGEAIYPNQYGNWTDALSRAAFNYQFAHVEPGAWAHNFDYMTQLLYDSIEDLGGDVSGLTRP